MITTGLIYLFYATIWLITAPIRLLSDVSLSANITTAIATTNTYLSAIDFIFPVATFITIFGLILGIEVAIMLWKLINWAIHKIPTIS
jgi:hypothetical protein